MGVLEVRKLKKSFGTNDVLKAIDFEVKDGEFLSVLGPSGCGKTTLLRLLIGLEMPDSGVILKDGRDITAMPPSGRGMGLVFQNYALFENMTVLQNVAYALKRRAQTRQDAEKRAMEMLHLVGLYDQKDKKPRVLSGGQQQRVAIARTLVLEPDIILFDEPMSALDVDTRLMLRQELKQLQAQVHSTMIYITHDQEEAFALSDRIMVMHAGAIAQLDTPMNIIDAPANDYVEKFVIKNIRIKIDSLSRFKRAGA